jgi:aryl-alcohol dehydrogenase-like predicted oxidoreductase
MLADLRGWSPFVALQLPYSLADRDAERELLPMAQALGLSVTVWGSLEGGALTGKYLDETSEPRRYDGAGERVNSIAREVIEVADEIGATPSQVALAWVRAQPWPLIPILGARTEAQIRDNLGVLEVELSEEHVERLSTAGGVRLGFPREFLEGDHVRGLIFSDTFELIDDPRAGDRRKPHAHVA